MAREPHMFGFELQPFPIPATSLTHPSPLPLLLPPLPPSSYVDEKIVHGRAVGSLHS